MKELLEKIRTALDKAKEHHLEVEFVTSLFINARTMESNEPDVIIIESLREWDLL